ncbi:DUF4129 domain-containing protein [Constantimarinum furrinae]|uniref:DUF4129 domain-containing protein n=1 Tax=Constantimarinum furrinae TaxID=2562285 RepID=A0A7G8PVS2_9FLAO|nr:DUF4129 domain-containing protein [Constantimarinum furrinae]QNJ98438.1 hypothetical protein ALE3EI_1891 [Constantimarinum furrinae]
MRIVFILGVFLMFFSEAQAQDSLSVNEENVVQYDRRTHLIPVEFNSEKITDYKNDEDFNYTELIKEPNFWDRFKIWLSELWSRFWEWLLGDNQNTWFWSNFIAILPYLIIGGILFFIIWLFYKLNPGAKLLGRKKGPEVFFTEEEEIIKTRDIQKLIDRALQHKDYRLAVRYHYLLILKKLTNAEIIDYEFDKTNTDYIEEITSEMLKNQYKKVTLLYDYIWYGSFAVTETDYLIAQGAFKKLEHQIPDNNE